MYVLKSLGSYIRVFTVLIMDMEKHRYNAAFRKVWKALSKANVLAVSINTNCDHLFLQ